MKAGAMFQRGRLGVVLALVALATAAGAGCAGEGQRNLTIQLVEYRGEDAPLAAENLRTQLLRQGMADIFIVQDDEVTTVYVGHYSSIGDSRAQDMLQTVRQIRDTDGRKPFEYTKVVPLPEIAPDNPWPLERTRGYFTLLVAIWEKPGRMAKAQTYGAALRQQGYEAYVYQGPRASMVTLGSFGMSVFEDPTMYGQPNIKPKIASPVALELIQRFPRIRIEGTETAAKDRKPTALIEIPGRRPPTFARNDTKYLYRVTLAMTDTTTGLADGRLSAQGGAESKDDLAVLTPLLLRQTLGGLPAGRVVRVGLVGVQPLDSGAAAEKADAAVLAALTQALAGARGVTVLPAEETQRLLQASGRTFDDILLDPHSAKDVKGIDFLCTGAVQSFGR
jgi:hypothetical protein